MLPLESIPQGSWEGSPEYLVCMLRWRELVWIRNGGWCRKNIEQRNQSKTEKAIEEVRVGFWDSAGAQGPSVPPQMLIFCFGSFLFVLFWCVDFWRALEDNCVPLAVTHRSLHKYISKHICPSSGNVLGDCLDVFWTLKVFRKEHLFIFFGRHYSVESHVSAWFRSQAACISSIQVMFIYLLPLHMIPSHVKLVLRFIPVS